MKALGAYLERKKITQAAFADQIGVSQPTIANLVNDVHGASTALLKRLSSATGLTIDELLADAGSVSESDVPHTPPSFDARRRTVSKVRHRAPAGDDITSRGDGKKSRTRPIDALRGVS